MITLNFLKKDPDKENYKKAYSDYKRAVAKEGKYYIFGKSPITNERLYIHTCQIKGEKWEDTKHKSTLITMSSSINPFYLEKDKEEAERHCVILNKMFGSTINWKVRKYEG